MEQQSSDKSQQPPSLTEVKHEAPRAKPHAKVKILLAFVVLALIIACLIIVLLTGKKDEPSKSKTNQTTQTSKDDFAAQYLQNCKQRTVSFTKTPVPLEQMGYLEPMGKMSDGHVTPTDHVYIAPLSMRAADNTTDVVMPADGTVISIQAMPSQYIGDRQNQNVAPEDHRLVIAHNCRYVSIFIHVHKLSDALKAALGGAAVEPNTQKSVTIELKAGDKAHRK